MLHSALSLLLLSACQAEGKVHRVQVSTGRCKDWALNEAAGAGSFDLHPSPVNGTVGFEVYAERGRELDAVHAALAKAGCPIASETAGKPLSADPPSGYRDLGQLREAFEKLVQDYPGLAQIEDLTTSLGVEPTIEARHIFALKISDRVAEDENEPNQLVVAAHHSNELAGPEAALFIATKLLTEYSASREIRAIVDGFQSYVIWVQNPDGYEYVWNGDANWRKNRRRNAGGTYGVDLNRNYPFGWSFSCGGSTTETSSNYRGTQAASEPEVRTMIAFQSDRQFARLLDLHAYARDVRQNYASCASLPAVVDNEYRKVTATVSGAMRYTAVRSCCTGGNIANSYHDHGTMSLLAEIGTAFQPSYQETLEEIEDRIWPGVLAYLTLPIPCSGLVTDIDTGEGLAATITLPEIDFEYGELHKTTPRGRFHLWLPAGEWEAIVESPRHTAVRVKVRAGPEGFEEAIKMRPI